MKAIFLTLAVVLSLLLAGCGGGGGGGGTATITGRVIEIESGSAPNPAVTVQSGSATATTALADGSFSLTVPVGTTTLNVNTASFGQFAFTITAASGTQDVGDLYIGPNKVSVTGKVLDSSNQNPVANATVKFGGVVGTTDSTGTFTLQNVAYPSANFATFFGIVGNVTQSSYFATTFSTSPNTATNGVVSVSDILMTPLSNPNPPPAPYTIFGHLNPSSLGAGATVVLKQNGTAIRQTVGDSTGTYYFWVPAGSYTVSATNGSHTSGPDTIVNVPTNSSVVEQDLVIN